MKKLLRAHVMLLVDKVIEIDDNLSAEDQAKAIEEAKDRIWEKINDQCEYVDRVISGYDGIACDCDDVYDFDFDDEKGE